MNISPRIHPKYILKVGIFILVVLQFLLPVVGYTQNLREIEPQPVPKQVEAPTANGAPTVSQPVDSGDETVGVNLAIAPATLDANSAKTYSF